MVDLNDNPASALCAPLRLQDTDSDKLGLEPSYSSDLDKTAAGLIFRKRKKYLQKDFFNWLKSSQLAFFGLDPDLFDQLY